jgi:hypothetical protein
MNALDSITHPVAAAIATSAGAGTACDVSSGMIDVTTSTAAKASPERASSGV